MTNTSPVFQLAMAVDCFQAWQARMERKQEENKCRM